MVKKKDKKLKYPQKKKPRLSRSRRKYFRERKATLRRESINLEELTQRLKEIDEERLAELKQKAERSQRLKEKIIERFEKAGY